MAWEPSQCQHCGSTRVEYLSDDPKDPRKEIWYCQTCRRKFSYTPPGNN